MALEARAELRESRALTSMTRYSSECGVERVLDVALADDAQVADDLEGDAAELVVLGVG